MLCFTLCILWKPCLGLARSLLTWADGKFPQTSQQQASWWYNVAGELVTADYDLSLSLVSKQSSTFVSIAFNYRHRHLRQQVVTPSKACIDGDLKVPCVFWRFFSMSGSMFCLSSPHAPGQTCTHIILLTCRWLYTQHFWKSTDMATWACKYWCFKHHWMKMAVLSQLW